MGWKRHRPLVLGGLVLAVLSAVALASDSASADAIELKSPGLSAFEFIPGATFAVGDDIYIFGGNGGEANRQPDDRILKYSPATDTVQVMPYRLPTPRYGTTGFSDGEFAYVMGGMGVNSLGSYEGITDVLRYNVETGAVTTMTPLPVGLAAMRTAWNGDVAYLFGGSLRAPPTVPCSGDCFPAPPNPPDSRLIFRFDPQANNITELETRLPEGFTHNAATWANQSAFLHSALWGNYSQILEFKPSPEELVLRTSSSYDFLETSAAMVGEHFYLFGGVYSTTSADGDGIVNYAIGRYPKKSWRYELLPQTLPSGMGGMAAVARPEGVFLFGGFNAGCLTCSPPADVMLYHPTTIHAPIEAFFVARPNFPTRADVIAFNDTSYKEHGRATSWSWDFGDGTTSTSQNAAHQFSEMRDYTVRFRVTDNEGFTAWHNRTLIITNHAPIARMAPVGPTVVQSQPILFRDESVDPDGTLVSRRWSFGDGGASVDREVRHAFATPGEIEASLTVTDNDGASTTERVQLMVEEAEFVADFSYDPPDVRVNEYVRFTDTSFHPYNAGLAYEWTFDDGATSAERNPQHVYTSPGPRVVSLYVKAGNYERAWKNRTIDVAPSDVSFTFSPREPSLGDAVKFTDTSPTAQTITARGWSFGDGAFSTEAAPTHLYEAPGDYVVKLAIARSDGSRSEYSRPLRVSLDAPEAAFTLAPEAPTTSDTVVFTDTSQGGGITRWSWDFGDGTTSALSRPVHRYEGPGTYRVILNVWNSVEDSSVASADVVVVAGRTEPPTANFTWEQDGIQRRLVRFQDASRDLDGAVVSYAWDFGDGETLRLAVPLSAEQLRPRHEYAGTGSYEVFLTVRDDAGAVSTTFQTVVVEGAFPTAAFTSAPESARVRQPIQFTDASQDPDGQIFRREWDFGDGASSSQQNPSHAFAQAGAYIVRLSVTDDDGFTSTSEGLAVIAPASTVRSAAAAPTGGGFLPGFEVAVVTIASAWAARVSRRS